MGLRLHELDSVAVYVHIADDRVVNYREHLTILDYVLILDDLADVVDRAGGHAVGKAAVDDLGNGEVLRPLLYICLEVFKMRNSRHVVDIARIGDPLRLLGHIVRQLLEEMLIAAGNNNESVLRLVRIVRRGRGVGVAGALRHHAGIPVSCEHVLEADDDRIDKRHVDSLPVTDDRAGMERC